VIPRRLFLYADVSELSIRSIFIGGVPKRRHIKNRRRGITQKKTYNNSANICLLPLLLNDARAEIQTAAKDGGGGGVKFTAHLNTFTSTSFIKASRL
jgi:hypothetical protein